LTSASVGIYEKGIPLLGSWKATLESVGEAGFDFLELSIDESQQRMNRLSWSPSKRTRVANAIAATGIPIGSITLSAHRRFPLGSADISTRDRARAIMRDAIGLAADLGASILQIAGYFVYYEPHHLESRKWFVEGLQEGCRIAEDAGIVLAIENVDGDDVVGIGDALKILDLAQCSNLLLYPDVGNLAANGLDVADELSLASGRLAAVHLKDARLGEFRRVPFGEGIVPFPAAYAALAGAGFNGPYVIEMWNDVAESNTAARLAREWIATRMNVSRHPHTYDESH